MGRGLSSAVESGPIGPGVEFGGGRSARACPSRAFICLKQDVQDCQDLQDGAAWAYGPKVWKTFMSIDISRNYDAKVREDLNRPRARSSV